MKDADLFEKDQFLETDIVIIGSGAGGSNAARILSKRHKVLIVEEGPYQRASDFEGEYNAYKELYQEGSSRTTKDRSIRVLQGRAVGGSALVNWTTSFRTPKATLDHWKERYGIDFGDRLDFSETEKSYGISKWHMAPNKNNEKLKLACESMGWEWDVVKRNVKGCANLGLCGLGCPINAKQSPIVSSLPRAQKNGAQIVYNLKALKLVHRGDKIEGLECAARNGKTKTRIKAKKYILSAGAIGTPAIMLRSGLKDRSGMTGKRTFLHPVCLSAAFYKEDIEGAKGAPQSVYSDHFLRRKFEGTMGYKLETAPIYPVLYASAFSAHGEEHRKLMEQRPKSAAHIALMRDGFHPESPGGQVELDKFGNPLLDYEITPYVWQGLQEALANMAQAQLASGAQKVSPGLAVSRFFTDAEEAKRFIMQAPREPMKFPVFSAHVMGGALMGARPGASVVDLNGRHRDYANLYVMDASVFPTSVGANPMETIFAVTSYLANKLA